MYRLGAVLPLIVLLAACGGSGGNKNTGGGGSGSGAGSPPGQFVAVGIGSGQTQSGIDVAVPAPAATTPPNAQVLGVALGPGTASAANTGAQIHVGQSATVFLCGPGLSGSMQVKISGPADITTGAPTSANCTDQNKNSIPGIQFGVNVSSNATLGGRTVLLISSQNDITTFTGGLEVIP